MSRVWKPNSKYTNNTKYSPEVTNYPKMKRSKTPDCDYTKTGNFSTWLFLKYDMTYKTFRNKSKNRRAVIKEEFLSDTDEYRNGVHRNITESVQKTVDEIVNTYNCSLHTAEKLSKYPDILDEYTNCYFNLDNCKIRVEGYTAKELYAEYNLSPIGAYEYLIYLREEPINALWYLQNRLPKRYAGIDVYYN